MRVLTKRLLTLGIAAFVIASTVFGPASLTFAQENNGGGLEISPALVELNGSKGNTYTININVTNVTTNDLIFDGYVNDFGARDETGTPSIILDESTTATSIKTWVRDIPEFNLKAGEKKKLSTSITIPGNATPGGHYGVIRFSGRIPNNPSSNVNLTASAGTLILIKVDGAITEKLNLLTFQAAKNSKPSGIFESGPITFVTRFKNEGSVHVKPAGQIEIKDAFGNKVDTLTVNSEKGNILPTSTRRFETTLNKSWLFGKYTADISVAYGNTGGAIVESMSFWVIPYKIILVGIIALVTVIYILRSLVKRYNRFIIKNAHHGNKTKNNKKK